MKNFKVVIGKKDNKQIAVNKEELYKKAFTNELHKEVTTIQEIRDNLKQIVYYSVKYINQKDRRDLQFTWEQAELEFSLICQIKDTMKKLTLDEFINIFPIPKEYDGEKYGVKDYYYAIKTFGEYNYDEPIGENLEEILWDTMNLDIFTFNAYLLSVMSVLRRFQGKRGLMEEFLDEQGVETYTLNESSGKKYLQSNRTGKTVPVKVAKKRVPRYLKVVG